MIGYASIERFEGDKVYLEVEMHTITESRLLAMNERIGRRSVVCKELLTTSLESFEEGDILVVEHEAGHIHKVCGKDDEEKMRRIKELEVPRRIYI